MTPEKENTDLDNYAFAVSIVFIYLIFFEHVDTLHFLVKFFTLIFMYKIHKCNQLVYHNPETVPVNNHLKIHFLLLNFKNLHTFWLFVKYYLVIYLSSDHWTG